MTLAAICSPRSFSAADGVSAVAVAGPGFLNITVEAGAQGLVAADVVAAGAMYGHTKVLDGQKINVEFISANPTGPLHLGHTRWAVLGDAIGRVLSAAGADVTREFYINDRGVQMDHFTDSLIASALGLPKPEDGYARCLHRRPRKVGGGRTPASSSSPPKSGVVSSSARPGYELQLARAAGVSSSSSTPTSTSGSPRCPCTSKARCNIETLQRLKDLGHVYAEGGALWMRTTDFGDDKDRVLIKSDGELTYFASDTAYYLNKRAAASTTASTCSAPTTTATSAG